MTNPLRRTVPAAAALLGLALVAGCGSNDATAGDGATTPATTATSPTTPVAASSATSSAATATSEPAADTPTVLYYAVKTSLGDRITAEQHTGVSGLTAVQSTAPVDPDYRNLVPTGSLGTSKVDGGQITITVAKPSFATSTLAPAQAKLAVQQVVYSANAANGTATKPLPVHFVSATGKDSTYLGQPSLAKAGPQLQTLALMSVLSPGDGAKLSATSTTFTGAGSSFEATVGWKITDSSGKNVLHGSTMTKGWMDHLWPWKATVALSKLSAGDYTFTASTDDASGGEGPGPITDTKTFTIS
ncbi:MAG TPA: Gmad2 immunoglobulin-like domain-containing protein [Nocardioides sp.]|nr:Gmad2 immunoglobulin-like domain-containing protein [Nocardioides sp.]